MPTLLVLAAGMGSRFGGLKQLEPVGPSGEVILDYSIHDAIRAGFEKVVFVIRKEFDSEFKEKLGSKYEKHIQVDYAYQELDAALPEGFVCPEERTKPWGTGHAILVAKEKITEPFAMINADDYYGHRAYKNLYDFLKGADTSKHDYCMVAFELEKTLSHNGTVSRGICHAQNGWLEGVEEHTKIERKGHDVVGLNESNEATSHSPDTPVSMNMWGFTPLLFDLLEKGFTSFIQKRGLEPKSEYYIPFVVDQALKEGQATVHVLESPDQWYGVTYREDTPIVQGGLRELVEKGIYPNNLHSS